MTSRILLADDSITIQKVVNLTFADEGIEVIAVSNGEVAERRLSEINPDLVLADIFMPGKNGYELCEFVKQSPQFRAVPVILLVGAFEPFNEAEARRVRADAHLTKPFESRTLVETVRKLIGKSGRAAASQSGSLAGREPQGAVPIPEAQPVTQPAFNLDLSSMTSEWSPAPTSAADSNQFGAVPTTAPLSDPSPLDLDYGGFAHGDNAPSSFQMAPEQPGSDTGFSFVSSVKDTAELPPIESIKETAPANGGWRQESESFQEQNTFSETSAHAGGNDQTFGAPLDSPNETAGFKVQSTFSGQPPSVVLDFEKLEAPAPSVPDNVVSFDVDFSSYSTSDSTSQTAAPEPEPEPARPLELASSEPIAWQDASHEHSVSQEADAGFGEQNEAAAQSLALDDPLGDVLSTDASQPESAGFEFVPQEREEVEEQPSSSIHDPWEGEAPSTFAPLDDAEPSGAPPYQDISGGDRASSVVHSGLSFEAFSPVADEPAWKEPAVEAVEPEPVEAARSDAPHSEEAFTSSEMWSSEVPQFAAIDIEAVAVDDARAGTDYVDSHEDSLDGGAGFAFASVGDPLVEEPLPPPPPPPQPVVESAPDESQLSGDPVNLPQSVIDEIVRRVVAQIGDAVVREIAWEVVPDCVERVVEKLTNEAATKRM